MQRSSSRPGRVIDLVDGWEYAQGRALLPGPLHALDHILASAEYAWLPIGRARTVAGALRVSRAQALPETYPEHLDDNEHWFGVDVQLPDLPGGYVATLLELDGVATIAEFFWNDVPIGTSTSMFRAHSIDISAFVHPGCNRLTVRCLSLTTHLSEKAVARAAWKTRLVENQKLRSVRTTLLGRAVGWSPPTTVVGVWGEARLVLVRDIASCTHNLVARFEELVDESVDESVDGAAASHRGFVAGTIEIRALKGIEIVEAFVRVGTSTSAFLVAEVTDVAEATQADDPNENFRTFTLSGSVTVSSPELWWPHTHGATPRYEASLSLTLANGPTVELSLGMFGFRTIVIDRGLDGTDFRFLINGEPVFVRGGAWFPLDPTTFVVDRDLLRERLVLVKQAGLNMVRVSGTAAYESRVFFEICDELGLLVWHDLPFANFDYPKDTGFLQDVINEVTAFLGRVSASPSLCVVSGNSEADQQAAMMGVALEAVGQTALSDAAAQLLGELRADLIFVPSSPTGGHVPFVVHTGVSHYFGVGAYRRPLADSRQSGVRFTSECLAFANVPVRETVRSLMSEGSIAPTHPAWKERVPRDRGTGWDFDDVRDYYARELFDLDSSDLRYADPERYLAVGRAISCAVMEKTLGEWRRPRSTCRGALLWTLNDIWPGAGWGIIDSLGRPKAAYWGVKRATSRQAVVFVDEGLNGLDIFTFNDYASKIAGRLEVRATKGTATVYEGTVASQAEKGSSQQFRADEVFGRFSDPTYAYRFGPRGIDAISAVWFNSENHVVARNVFAPTGERLMIDHSLSILGSCEWTSSQRLVLKLQSNRTAHFVTVDTGATPVMATDDHFSLVPNDPPHVVEFVFGEGIAPKRVYVSALNGAVEWTIAVPERPTS